MVDDFRDKPVKVGVSLAMGIIRKIDRNTVNENREIRSMIGIESSNQILVRFPSSLMLHRVETGNRTGENIDRRSCRAKLEVFLADVLFRGCGNRLFSPNINFNRLCWSALPRCLRVLG